MRSQETGFPGAVAPALPRQTDLPRSSEDVTADELPGRRELPGTSGHAFPPPERGVRRPQASSGRGWQHSSTRLHSPGRTNSVPCCQRRLAPAPKPSGRTIPWREPASKARRTSSPPRACAEEWSGPGGNDHSSRSGPMAWGHALDPMRRHRLPPRRRSTPVDSNQCALQSRRMPARLCRRLPASRSGCTWRHDVSRRYRPSIRSARSPSGQVADQQQALCACKRGQEEPKQRPADSALPARPPKGH